MMLLNWIMLSIELHRISGKQRKDPLADPLDAPEWEGLQWALPLLSRMAQRPYKVDQASAPKNRVKCEMTASGYTGMK
ncbi:hypothetical protein QO004_001967 [Rhizobium mesoamericanum]|uniref:hypothetical protein n=1 Tax=Rhizobium mesoamericanum TaxID=1079800 RepID=UPI00278AC3B0|nr:hypothetical protein [Rhizobium mesoamericanum]MDQ0560185.1 hypothetical protein [Rhizobium mesoamericanum]